MKRLKKGIGLLLILLSVGLIVFAIKEMKKHNKQEQQVKLIKEAVKETEIQTDKKEESKEFKEIDWKRLYELNSDTKYYLDFPKESDIKVSEPVVQTNNNDTYISRPFVYGLDNSWGTPFLDYRSDLEDDYKLIYGHAFGNKPYQFTELKKFATQENIKDNPHNTYFYLYVPDGERTSEIRRYRIFSVLDDDIYHEAVNPRKDLVDGRDEFINKLKKESILNFNVSVPRDKDILSLYTCRHPNGLQRLYVIGYLEDIIKVK